MIKRCWDVYPLLGWNYEHDNACCISCHEDEDYGYEMCWATLPDGEDVYVCCRVARAVDELKVVS